MAVLAGASVGVLIITLGGGVSARMTSGRSANKSETQHLGIFFKFPQDTDQVIHGPAPLEVTAYGRTYAYDFEGTVNCTELEWLWGDGTTEKRQCQGSGEEASLGKHTYTTPGIYYPRLRVSGWKLDEVTTASRIVAVEGSQRSSATGTIFVYWGLWSLVILIALASWVALGRWAQRGTERMALRRAGRASIVLLLWGAVPPFSYLPNPLALAYVLGGEYSYDPRLPFANKMMIIGDPTIRLTPKLSGLIGQTGLDPLDPVHPLKDFEFTKVSNREDWDGWSDSVIVTAQMMYADGTRRSYKIPMRPDYSPWGFYVGFDERVSGWNDLNRLYAEHVELPYTPLAKDGSGTPLHLGEPQRVRVPSMGEQLEATEEGNWAYIGGGLDNRQKILLSPDGGFVLINRWGRLGTGKSLYELWAIRLDGTGTEPVRLTDDVLDYEWSPDGQYVIFNQAQTSVVYAVKRDGSGKHKLNTPDYRQTRLPGLNKDGAWFAKDSRVWSAPFDGGPAQEVSGFSEIAANYFVYPSADGSRIAYPYSSEWYIQERGGGSSASVQLVGQGLNTAQMEGDPRDVAWSQDGSKLALVSWLGHEWYPNQETNAALMVFDHKGQPLQEVKLADYGKASTPYWLPNGEHILVQTLPYAGRRIVVVEVDSGKAWDLSRPRWDAWFGVEQSGKYLVLSTGRGGFWRVELARSAADVLSLSNR